MWYIVVIEGELEVTFFGRRHIITDLSCIMAGPFTLESTAKSQIPIVKKALLDKYAKHLGLRD